MEDVDVVDGWNRDAVEREIDPGSTVGEILLADDVLDEDQLSGGLAIPDTLGPSRRGIAIDRLRKVPSMATHARVEVVGMVLVAHDLEHPREVGQELELSDLQHRSGLVWRREEVP